MKGLIYLEMDQVAFDPELISVLRAREEGSYVELSTGAYFNLITAFDDLLEVVLGWLRPGKETPNG